MDGIGIGDQALIAFSDKLASLSRLKKLQITAELDGTFPEDGIYLFEEQDEESEET